MMIRHLRPPLGPGSGQDETETVLRMLGACVYLA